MANEFDPLEYRTIADTVVSALLKRPLQKFPLEESFPGAGVYLLYYRGGYKAYKPISNTRIPIYVGKAIPSGSRRGTSSLQQIEETPSPALFARLRDHWQSIEAAKNLSVKDFRCRYLVVTQIWISIAESLLIQRFQPLWNAKVDGFGLHDPGKTRYTQKRSDWDTLHPGRHWGPKMKPGKSVDEIIVRIQNHFSSS